MEKIKLSQAEFKLLIENITTEVIKEKKLGSNFDAWADLESDGEHTKGKKRDRLDKEKVGNKNGEHSHKMNHARGRSGIDEGLGFGSEKRYVAVVDFYVWANSDEEAIEQTRLTCSAFSDDDDNQCGIVKIVEQPTGTMGNRLVYGK